MLMTIRLWLFRTTTSTIENCYDILLKNYDYTIGKVLEYYMYALHYEGDAMLSFCGFHKEHPHDDYSILRIAFKNASEPAVVKQFLRDALFVKHVGIRSHEVLVLINKN